MYVYLERAIRSSYVSVVCTHVRVVQEGYKVLPTWVLCVHVYVYLERAIWSSYVSVVCTHVRVL